MMKLLARVPQSCLTNAVKKSINQRHGLLMLQRCRFFSENTPRNRYTRDSIVTPFPALTDPIPNLPKAVYSSTKEEHQTTKVTVLPNGLRVASENRFGQFCTIGVLVDSGSRYEVAYPSGISHFLEKLAFGATKIYQSKDEILRSLENHGGICDCQASRETAIYAVSAERNGLEEVTKMLADVVLRPKLTDEEIMSARQALSFELESLHTKPEQEPLLNDMIHAAAYRDNTLGLPKICPKVNIEKIDRNILLDYLQNHYIPSRMVVAAVGVDHEDLVRTVEKYFTQEQPIWVEEGLKSSTGVDTSIAQYTGGYILEECNIPVYAGPSGLPELSHLMIGLESCSYEDEDFVPLCVLNMIMGGGGSFSAGGPGKGMYSRLYTNVLSSYPWFYNATAYNYTYSDTGIFCIHASCIPAHVKDMTEVIVNEMAGMTNAIQKSELERAKKQLQSMLLMNLEQRPVVFEDIGRQVLATGSRKQPDHYIKAIGAVTADNIVNVARRLLKSPVSVAARGEVRNVPPISDIQSGLNGQGRLRSSLGKLYLFR